MNQFEHSMIASFITMITWQFFLKDIYLKAYKHKYQGVPWDNSSQNHTDVTLSGCFIEQLQTWGAASIGFFGSAMIAQSLGYECMHLSWNNYFTYFVAFVGLGTPLGYFLRTYLKRYTSF